MVKAYLRYEQAGVYGVIASNANVLYDDSGKRLFTSSLENVSVWDVKSGAQVQQLSSTNAAGTSAAPLAEVTQIARLPGGTHLAAGYSDGTVRLWDLAAGECVVTLKGHKSAVTALRFHPGGALLASGAKDTDIIIWDVVGEAGLYRLRGHKDQVTDLAFLDGREQLVSCSKDGTVRVWDLETQHCCQTLTGYKGEVWSLDVHPQGDRLVTGSTDLELRMYAVGGSEDVTDAVLPAATGGKAAGRQVLRAMGSVRRQAQERAALVRFDAAGGLLMCHSAGKGIEVFRVRDEDEAQRKLKRRKRRKREKAHKAAGKAADGDVAQPGTGNAAAGNADNDLSEDDEAAAGPQAADQLAPLTYIRTKSKVRSCCFAPPAAARKKGCVAQLAVALANNSIEVLDVHEGTFEAVTKIDQAGHRSDVRAVALSADDRLLLSTSSNSVKLWNPTTGACLSTVESGYGVCATFAPGGRHAVVGTKEGTIEVFDLGASARVHVEQAHKGAVWSMALLPDKTGFVSGGEDKEVKIWQWSVLESADGHRQLSITRARGLSMSEGVLCVRVSPDGRLLAVSLLDSTIKVFYLDTLRFFLSLYGHKLPVNCLDISSDSTMLVSGSADKNIKVWGLDFGDCHKSIFAHQDSVMQVSFVRNTHYVFSVGKDKMVRYWDMDRWEQLLELPGHHGEVWGLALSQYGDFLVTGSHDRSIRRWERTTEPFFVEEEREKRLESMFEADLDEADRDRKAGGAAGDEDGENGTAGGPASAGPAARKTLETLTAADAIIDALDLAAHEAEKEREYAEARGVNPGAKPPAVNPMMMGMRPAEYVLRALGGVRANDLELALIMLPFSDVLRLLEYLAAWLRAGTQVELAARVAALLLRLHQSQLAAAPAARAVLVRLHKRLRGAVSGLKATMGFNLAAMGFIQRQARERAGMAAEDSILPVKRQLQETA